MGMKIHSLSFDMYYEELKILNLVVGCQTSDKSSK